MFSFFNFASVFTFTCLGRFVYLLQNCFLIFKETLVAVIHFNYRFNCLFSIALFSHFQDKYVPSLEVK